MAIDTHSEYVLLTAIACKNGYGNAPQWYVHMHITCLVRFWRSGLSDVAVRHHDAAVMTRRHNTEKNTSFCLGFPYTVRVLLHMAEL